MTTKDAEKNDKLINVLAAFLAVVISLVLIAGAFYSFNIMAEAFGSDVRVKHGINEYVCAGFILWVAKLWHNWGGSFRRDDEEQ